MHREFLFDRDFILLFGFLATALCYWVLCRWCLPGRCPWTMLWGFVKRHATEPQYLFYAFTLLGIIFLNVLETRFDELLTDRLPWAFTGVFMDIEGSSTALFQWFHAPWLTYGLSVVYLYLFPVMGVAAVMITYHQGERRLSRMIFWGAVFNYILIIPFYTLVPVAERWAAGDGQVAFMMDTISPLLIEGLRPMSGLNNCFPSFHTSLAITIAMVASHSANKRFRRTFYTLAGLVVYSTLYLGFHWVLDALSGAVFAGACTVLATWAIENLPLELALSRSR